MSNISNYLRMAIMFGNNHSTTFITNLEKMVELVLNAKAPQAMLVSEIVADLNSGYNLSFTDIEVTQAIEGHRGSDRIVCFNPTAKKVGEKKYLLTEKAAQSIENQESQISVTGICDEFLRINPEIEIDTSSMESLIDRYFYRCFNSNATTIMQLLKQDYTDGVLLSDSDLDAQFSDQEKEILNTFIYWENSEKDRFVYQMVSCCFDYCTMTAKKDDAVYETVFKNKFFVLDTNIIFRVIGINQDSRKTVIDAFLKKCEEVGITLVVTNETRAEIRNTINYNIDRIKDLIKNSTPVKSRFVRECANTQINEDFYQFYYDWCMGKGHRSGDIEGFREDLLKTADRVCIRFKDVVFTTFATVSKEKFEAYTQSLRDFKIAQRGYAREESVQTDVNNFMYVVGMNEKKGASDFFALSYFHISADHPFCNWAKDVRKGAIPEVVLPSVWYSIILHYAGRAVDNDDYAAFTRFLNFSLSTDDTERNVKKTVLLQKVSQLNEPVDVKEEILFDVGQKLSSDYKDADDNTIEYLIGESNQTITEKRVAEAVGEQERISALALESQKADSIAETNLLARKHEQEINKLTADFDERLKQELASQNADAKEKEKNARVNERKRHIDIEAQETAKKKKRRYVVATVTCILIPLAIAGVGIYKAWTMQLPPNFSEIITAICGLLGLILEFVVFKLFYENWFCELKTEKIEEREKKKLEKKYPPVD